MEVSFHMKHDAAHQIEHGAALMEGMQKHGLNPIQGIHNQHLNTDVAVIWSWKQQSLIRRQFNSGRHVLVMERGFIPPRMEWCSLTFDGFNGRGKGVPAPDSKRFDKHFSHLLKPWREDVKNCALVVGQVPNDPALNGLDIYHWVEITCARLHHMGYRVIYRPHPWVASKIARGEIKPFYPKLGEVSTTTLQQDFDRAGIVVTYSSNTGTESVLQGIPTVSLDEGSLAHIMSAQDLHHSLVTPDRTKWCNDLSYRQWTMEELRNGDAWDFMKTYLAK